MPADQNRTPLESSFVDFVGSLIRTFTRIPGIPVAYRDRLYGYLNELRTVDSPEKLADLGKRVDATCSNVVAESGVPPAIADQEKELRAIIEAIGTSLKSMSEVNASTGTRIDGQLSDLTQAIVEDGEPARFSQKIEQIAHGIKESVTVLSKEVARSRTQVKESSSRVNSLEKELEQARAETLRDGLTGLANRRSFNQRIQQALASYDPHSTWCVIMLDVDHFKQVNDTHGHLIGDALLVKLARTLNGIVTASNFLARYGGEEFVVMLPATQLNRAVEFCQNLLHRIRASRWLYRSGETEIPISATVSAGIAVQRPADTPETLLARADGALYNAKSSGRDRFCTELDIT